MKKKMNNSSFINASSISNDADKITFFPKEKKKSRRRQLGKFPVNSYRKETMVNHLFLRAN